jgi:hypothetical protein
MDSPEQVSNEFRRKLRGEEKRRREQLLNSSKIATTYNFRVLLLSPAIQPGFFTASSKGSGTLKSQTDNSALTYWSGIIQL